MSRIFVLHENDEWTAPLRVELDLLRLPYEDWYLDRGEIDLSASPPDGVFYNRMSASSHTRDHRFAGELTAGVLAWLEVHQRRVLNDSRALQLEMSKVLQYTGLEKHGIPTPHTVATVGKQAALDASRRFAGPFITKHNRGGKGLGVRLFREQSAFEEFLSDDEIAAHGAPIDGVLLLQEFIASPDASITRCEFIGGEFLYAVRVDTSEGFELCPADVCEAGEDQCPATRSERSKFEILAEFEHPLLEPVADFLTWNGIDVAAVEMIFDLSGRAFVYDVNTNTNYNRTAERKAGVSGMRSLAEYLATELAAKEQGNHRVAARRASSRGAIGVH